MVQSVMTAAPKQKPASNRERLLELAEQLVLQKGFASTSIEELIAGVGITKSGFFYHFKDKNDLARQLFERFLDEDSGILDTLESRARELSDDPLQSFLIFLNLYAEMMDEMPELHPGCLVAMITYQEQMFDRAVREMNAESVIAMRLRFARWLEEIVAKHPPRVPIDINAMADNVTVIVEGAIILSKAMNDRGLMGRHTRLFRDHVKLVFGAA
jgi:TetR/AcrR family transcriptional repressor of nem operon